ncbi:WxL protein peptidoglycan domain-containing protein [Secundilactobacillus odoratitofui]|uniref:WxL protein peptidoglycan domain-containing protein n=1 Tax=Secundilactobacillus odoratitofui TaxID=480930 RepID=UPI0006CF8F4A
MSSIKRVTKFVLLTLAICITALSVSSGVTQAKSSVNQFQVKPILPADNAAKSSYFDLKVKPSQSRTLKIRILITVPNANNFTSNQVTPRPAHWALLHIRVALKRMLRRPRLSAI